MSRFFALSAHGSSDFMLSNFDGGFVWIHDRKILRWISVSRGHTSFAIEIVVLNGPGGHVGNVHLDEIDNILLSQSSLESANQGIENFGVARNQSAAAGNLIEDKFNDLLLIFATVTVSLLIGVTFAGESERAVPRDIIIAWLEHALAISPTAEGVFLIIVDVDATNSIDEVLDEIEVDTNILVDVDVKQFGESRHRELNATSTTRMSEFVW